MIFIGGNIPQMIGYFITNFLFSISFLVKFHICMYLYIYTYICLQTLAFLTELQLFFAFVI